MRGVVYCLPGMRYFGELAASVLGYELSVGGYVGDCDVCHIVGLYDPPNYDKTLSDTVRAKKRVIHWCGSDVSALQDASVLPEAVHVADSEGLVRELHDKGVDAKCVMWPTKHHFPVTPLPETPRIACYLGSDPIRYGSDMLQALGKAMPDTDIIAYMFGQYTPEQMEELVDSSSVYVRLTAHDGSAASAREFMEAGRRAVVTHELEHAKRIRRDDLGQLIVAVKKAIAEKQPDEAAAAYWHEQNAVERFLCDLKGVLDGE